MTPLNFSLAALALPGITSMIIWASRSLGVFRQHLISVWSCAFSLFWFLYWSWNSDFSQLASLFFVMYGVLLVYVKYTYFSDSVALFLSYLCVTGVLFSTHAVFQWVWIVVLILSLGSDRILGYKKSYDYRLISTMIVLMMPKNPWYIGALLSILVYALGWYFSAFSLGTSRKDDLWRCWVISLLCMVCVHRHIASNTYVWIHGVQGFTAFNILAGLGHKKYREPFPYVASILCTPWMYTVTGHMMWVMSTMGLLHWTYHVLTQYRAREAPYMTQTMAYVVLGGMGSVCLVCAAVCLWAVVSQGRGDVFSLGMYGISCIVQFEGVYSVLRSKKFNQSTGPEIYMICTGILIWSLWSGWIISRQIFSQFIPKM